MPATDPGREKLLFICTFNLSRSRTAEVLLNGHPLYEARSAGTHLSARVRVTAELVAWADRILVMEEHHAEFLRTCFPDHLLEKSLVSLDIADEYQPMAEDLFAILRDRLAPHLRLASDGEQRASPSSDPALRSGARGG
jgi:predicted protein tyrosine phosphatase